MSPTQRNGHAYWCHPHRHDEDPCRLTLGAVGQVVVDLAQDGNGRAALRLTDPGAEMAVDVDASHVGQLIRYLTQGKQILDGDVT